LEEAFNEGQRLNPETLRLKEPVLPLPAEGIEREVPLPTSGPEFEQWQNYKPGGDVLPCFPASTVVKTPTGDRPIESLMPGDAVFAFDLEKRERTISTVVRAHRNWTVRLVEIHAGGEVTWATGAHPFWCPDEGRWRRAIDLEPGCRLATLNGGCAVVESVAAHGADESSFNIEVAGEHTYFVSSAGLLVHNGDPLDSAFADQLTDLTQIYGVSSPDGTILYVGQTVKGIDTRLLQHIDDPGSALFIKLDDVRRAAPDFPANVYKIDELAQGTWTPYEAAVWEQHYIDANGGIDSLLNKQNAITPEKFELYRNMHNPCT